MGDPCARNHGFCGRAAFVDASAADVGGLDESGSPAGFGEGLGEGAAALAGADYHGFVVAAHCEGSFVLTAESEIDGSDPGAVHEGEDGRLTEAGLKDMLSRRERDHQYLCVSMKCLQSFYLGLIGHGEVCLKLLSNPRSSPSIARPSLQRSEPLTQVRPPWACMELSHVP